MNCAGLVTRAIVYLTSMRTAHVENMLQRGTVACRLSVGDRLWARHRSWSHGKGSTGLDYAFL